MFCFIILKFISVIATNLKTVRLVVYYLCLMALTIHVFKIRGPLFFYLRHAILDYVMVFPLIEPDRVWTQGSTLVNNFTIHLWPKEIKGRKDRRQNFALYRMKSVTIMFRSIEKFTKRILNSLFGILKYIKDNH